LLNGLMARWLNWIIQGLFYTLQTHILKAKYLTFSEKNIFSLSA